MGFVNMKETYMYLGRWTLNWGIAPNRLIHVHICGAFVDYWCRKAQLIVDYAFFMVHKLWLYKRVTEYVKESNPRSNIVQLLLLQTPELSAYFVLLLLRIISVIWNKPFLPREPFGQWNQAKTAETKSRQKLDNICFV